MYVLHGFPSGQLQSVTDAGADEGQAKQLGAATRFAAAIGETGWTAEFAIPLAAAGIELDTLEKIRFNLGARIGNKDGRGEWFAWTKTGKANYAVDRAGELVVKPLLRASAENILRNGDFEQELAFWRKTTNRESRLTEPLPVMRVRNSRNGNWCMRFDCSDAEAMKESIVKLIQGLPAELGPGTYVLRYDLCVSELLARGKSGMFCGYIRTKAEPTGSNAGQRKYACKEGKLPWSRRDCVITVPEGAKPVFVSLQLHKATGTVWVDNVALLRVPEGP